jgi:hypothetical protein
MPTSEKPVNSLGEFTDRVSKIRQSWGLAKHKADFTYHITSTTISIIDTGKGSRSVTIDIEAVLRKIEYWHQGSIT